MWHGNYVEANQAWAEACLAHRHEDAAEWLYSQRFVLNRHVPVFEDKWHPLARSLSSPPSRPRLVTSTSTSRENALAALHHDRKRVAAVHLRRYLCDAVRSGSLNDEIDARMLLGDSYAQTNEPRLAARRLILARDYESARSVAQDLGDSYLDVSDLITSPVSWVVATAFEFAAEEADLVPHASVDSLVDSALSAIDDVKSGKRADPPVYSPQITCSAYKMIGELSERLNQDHAVAVLESLSGHVTAEEHHYWPTDESHIRIAVTKDDEVTSVALDHLMGICARRAHPFSNKAKDGKFGIYSRTMPGWSPARSANSRRSRAFLSGRWADPGKSFSRPALQHRSLVARRTGLLSDPACLRNGVARFRSANRLGGGALCGTCPVGFLTAPTAPRVGAPVERRAALPTVQPGSCHNSTLQLTVTLGRGSGSNSHAHNGLPTPR